MRWEGRERSKNVEDRRGLAGPMVGGGLMVVIIGAIIALLNGGNLFQVVQQANEQLGAQQQAAAGAQGEGGPREDDKLQEFAEVVLKDTEDVWGRLFPDNFNRPYEEPVLVTFHGNVETRGCGTTSSAVGPFYCGGDHKLYVDLSFFQDLQTRFKAPGDFACAYVIAHEVGHHVQNQLGILSQVQNQQRRVDQATANHLSVRLELQADFLAGVWAHHAQKMKSILEKGDLQESLNAAAAVGDDSIMENAGIRPTEDKFTHGTAEQRKRWFMLGLETGDVKRLMEPLEVPDEDL